MASPALLAIAVVMIAGFFGGSALLPMKYARDWKFENTWLLYSIFAYLLSPWLVALFTIPHLSDVYAAAGTKAVITLSPNEKALCDWPKPCTPRSSANGSRERWLPRKNWGARRTR